MSCEEPALTKKTRVSLEIVITAIAFSVALTTTYNVQATKINANTVALHSLQSSLKDIDSKLDRLIEAQHLADALTAYGIRDRWSAGCMTEYDIEIIKQLKKAGIDVDFNDIRAIQRHNGFGSPVAGEGQ